MLATYGVGPLAIATIHYQVVAVDPGVEELLDDGIDGRTRLHQEDDLARCLDRVYQIAQALAPDKSTGRVGMLRDKRAHDLRRAVEHRDLEPVIGHIEGQVLSHDRKTNHPNIRSRLLCHTFPSTSMCLAGLMPAPQTTA